MRPFLCLLLAAALCGRAQENLIRNGAFEKDIEGWSQWFSPGQAEGEAAWRAGGKGGAMHVAVRKRSQPSAVQIYYGPFPVVAGAWYGVEFEGRAQEEATFRVAFMRNNAPYGILGLSTDVTVGKEWRRYAFLVQATQTLEDGRLDFFLPVGEFDLDNVVVRQLDGEPPRAEVQRVRLGPGVNGEAEHLIDGKMDTRVWLGGYPVMPTFVTLALGRKCPVARVVLQSEDRGRHLAMGRMECEVSSNGREWHKWAVFAKTRGKERNGVYPTVLSASGGSVSAQYVRLRVVDVKNSAPLREAAVYLAASADPAAMQELPPVPPSSMLAFLGWNYHRLGYDFSPGEEFVLTFTNQGRRLVQVGLSWTLESYAGDALAKGKAEVDAPSEAIVDVPLSLPADLADGYYRVRYSLADSDEVVAFGFDCRRAVPAEGLPVLRLGAYMDTQDPEGWLRLSAGPLAAHLDVQREVGDPAKVDAVVVTDEALNPFDGRAIRARKFVSEGGLALCVGKVGHAFDEMLPVVVDHERPRLDTLVTADLSRFGLAGTPLRQRAVRVRAKPGAEVLASWSDGTPAIVSGTFGQGKAVYVGTGLGRVWTQEELGMVPADRLMFPLLYELVHGRAAAEAARRLLSSPNSNWCGQRLDELSFGRYGWQVGEGGLVENIDGKARLSCTASKGQWGPVFPGGEVARGVPTSVNWLAKQIRWLDAAGKELARTTVSTGAACMLWETAEREVGIQFGGSFAICDVGGKAMVLKEGESVSGAQLTVGWFVLPGANEKERDAPRYVQFARRPESVQLADGALRVRFGAEAGTFWTGRLSGIRRFAPGETTAWGEGGTPAEVRERARKLARLCLAFPVAAQEEGEQVEGQPFWRVTDAFGFRETVDEFGTEPLVLAPVPPVLALVHAHSPDLARVVGGSVEDTGVATKYGPLQGVPGRRLVYEICQRADEHYGVVPVKGRDQVQDLVDFHGRLALKVGTRAPSGLVTGDGFLSDLREYMGCSSYSQPEAAPCLDLYKYWYCFPSVAGRPAYSAAARQEIDEHYRRVFRDTLDLYPHKTIVRYRREPWTGKDYTVSFIWPVSWRDGFRFFVDQNESSAVISYCLWTYAQYFGDWDTVRSNWHLARWLWAYLPRVSDWALMCSSNQEYFSTAGIDMLNSEYPGNLAVARMARMVGDGQTERLARHLAAKSSIPAVARFLLPAYIDEITEEGDPWRQNRFYWSMHEGGVDGSKTVVMRGAPWSILTLGIGMYDTSKGTGPEIAALYKLFVPELVTAYEKALQEAEKEYDDDVAWAHLMSRAFLGWPRDELVATARRAFKRKGGLGWQSTKYPHNLGAMAAADGGFHLLEWQPAAYVSGEHDPGTRTVTLDFENTDGSPAVLRAHSSFPVQAVAVEQGKAVSWEDDPATGVWTAQVEAKGAFRVVLRLGDSRRKTPCIYCPSAK